jgi:hypothetical protein
MRKIRSRAPGWPIRSVTVNDSSYISATTGELRGIPAAEPVLRLTFNIEAGGLADGASALFLIAGSIHADSGLTLSLGAAAPVLRQIGYGDWAEGKPPITAQVPAEWTLSDTAIERIEKIRAGGNLMLYPDFQYALFSPGTAMPGWQQPQRPIRVPWPGQPTAVRVDAHQWVKDVLEQWQLAAAVSLVVALPAAAATSEQKTVISRLMTAKQRLAAGTPDDIKASVAASREAVELLRTMRPAAVNTVAAKRGLAEREAVILDKTIELAQALLGRQPHRPASARYRLAAGKRSPRPRHCHQPGSAHLRSHLTSLPTAHGFQAAAIGIGMTTPVTAARAPMMVGERDDRTPASRGAGGRRGARLAAGRVAPMSMPLAVIWVDASAALVVTGVSALSRSSGHRLRHANVAGLPAGGAHLLGDVTHGFCIPLVAV